MNVSLDKVGKYYTGDWIFQNVSAQFETNNIYGIIGHNGSGKSTFLQILAGFITPNSGVVSYNNGSTTVEAIYRNLSLCTPYLNLANEFTIEEVIEQHMQHKSLMPGYTLESILEGTSLIDHKHKTLAKLSSGMVQRLKLALAIYTNSSLLILDEPCSNLDSQWSKWYARIIEQCSKDRTIIIGSNNNTIELSPCNKAHLDISAH